MRWDSGAKLTRRSSYAAFQVADQWVENIDAAQYAEFLERAYDVVYRELVDATPSPGLHLKARPTSRGT